MTSSAKSAGNAPSPIAALALKLVGGIAIVAGLVDFFVFLLPPDLVNRGWRLLTVENLVERGIVPLVGIALLFCGLWLDGYISGKGKSTSLMQDSRFWTCAFACFLGVFFTIAAPFYVADVFHQRQERLNQVSDRASQVQSQFEQRLAQEQAQRIAVFEQLQQNPDQTIANVDQLIAQNIINAEQAEQIRQLQGQPEQLKEYLAQQASQIPNLAEEARNRAVTEIGTEQQETTAQLQTAALKNSIRIATNSVLLALGYFIIGISGIRRLLAI
ncbi:MAG: HpsJ family protein [Cyanobacteria bacterium P01_C01_bin.118]